MKIVYLIITIFSFLLVACDGQLINLPKSEAEKIVIEARGIFLAEGVVEFKYLDVSAERFPTISGLSPRKVILRTEGLYIRLSEGFSSERGYFIPSSNSNQSKFISGGDPSYYMIYDSFYEYQIKG